MKFILLLLLTILTGCSTTQIDSLNTSNLEKDISVFQEQEIILTTPIENESTIELEPTLIQLGSENISVMGDLGLDEEIHNVSGDVTKLKAYQKVLEWYNLGDEGDFTDSKDICYQKWEYGSEHSNAMYSFIKDEVDPRLYQKLVDYVDEEECYNIFEEKKQVLLDLLEINYLGYEYEKHFVCDYFDYETLELLDDSSWDYNQTDYFYELNLLKHKYWELEEELDYCILDLI